MTFMESRTPGKTLIVNGTEECINTTVIDCRSPWRVDVFSYRMKQAEVSCPEVVLLKKHILVMSFIGKNHVPAPKLKDVVLSSEDVKDAYHQVLRVRTVLQVHTSVTCRNAEAPFCFLCVFVRAADAEVVPGV